MPSAEHYLPAAVSQNLAAAILGRSVDATRKLIEAGLLRAEGSGHYRIISLADIAALRGQPVSATEYLRAKAAVTNTYRRRSA